jgi:hypothetical protein
MAILTEVLHGLAWIIQPNASFVPHSSCDNFLPIPFTFFVVLIVPLFDAT